MSEYRQFLQERDQIDYLLQKGYKIIKVTESLNGDMVQFEKSDLKKEEPIRETLLISNPNARKYFSVKIQEQTRENIKAKGEI